MRGEQGRAQQTHGHAVVLHCGTRQRGVALAVERCRPSHTVQEDCRTVSYKMVGRTCCTRLAQGNMVTCVRLLQTMRAR